MFARSGPVLSLALSTLLTLGLGGCGGGDEGADTDTDTDASASAPAVTSRPPPDTFPDDDGFPDTFPDDDDGNDPRPDPRPDTESDTARPTDSDTDTPTDTDSPTDTDGPTDTDPTADPTTDPTADPTTDPTTDPTDPTAGDAGGCCEATPEMTGCDNDAVMACVCDEDSYCCDEEWDDACVVAVVIYGCGTCEGVGGEGACCTANGTPGCDDNTIEACVCEADSDCCLEAWDEICAQGVVAEGCGVCN